MTEIQLWTWGIAALATAGIIIRPFEWPEAIWAVAGALVLVVAGLVPVEDAFAGVGKGTDIYLFLAGMMLLAEIAREEGLFDWHGRPECKFRGIAPPDSEMIPPPCSEFHPPPRSEMMSPPAG